MDFRTVADNLRESFRVIAASRGPGEVRELPGVSVASAGVTFQMFNAAFLSTPAFTESDISRRVALAATHFQARSLEWAWWVCEGWLEEQVDRRWRRIFERQGMRHSVDLPGMVAETILPPVRPLPGLEFRRVNSDATKNAFCDISAACFNVPNLWFREVFDGGTVWENFASYVAYSDGGPVATAAAVIGGGAIGIYNVATVPEMRRRGYGEAVMRYALEDTGRRHGIQRSVLQSTPAGLRLYERMGYSTVTRISVWAS